MKISISKTNKAEHVYISRSYRDENGKSTSRIFKKLGTMAELLPLHDNDREKVIAWAKEQAKIYTLRERNDTLEEIPISLSQTRQISFDEQRTFSGGYLFLQKICSELGLNKICRDIEIKYNFEYDLSDILSRLICARILSPSSKLSSYNYMTTMLEKPNFSLHHIYRALDILAKESDTIQSMLYKNGKDRHNAAILYYDCTNFFFEIEEEDNLRKYGKSKEHRPLPIVQMGLFMDASGLPLAFSVFPGNENEQPSLIPLEKKIINEFEHSKFIICTDAGLASLVNRRFNDKSGRSFIVTQPLKTLKAHLRDWALNPDGWSLESGRATYNLTTIDETKYMNAVFHKERWINENGFEQRLIVSYSPKYKAYQREVRGRQIERASRIIQNGNRSKSKNHNSPERFIDELQLTLDGEIAEMTKQQLDVDRIHEEERFDGFTAVCTTLDDDLQDILRVNRRRWKIEESFRVLKNEFKARPVFLQREARIRAHFLTCFLSLYVYRILEKKLVEKYTVSELTQTLREMNFYRIKGLGFLPCYKRSEITDALHESFGFRTDKEMISEKKMKKIIRETKS